MDINDFLEYYKTKLLGKLYCHEESVPDDYHYKNMDKGCDHIGPLGYERVQVVDSWKKTVKKDKINKYNVIEIVSKLAEGKGWLEDESK